MLRTLLIALFAVVSFAQSDNPFDRAPADVDKALRERINEFFQFHVTGEFRKAESIVAEDTKDFFYTHNKPRYLSFEITRVDYSENFTRAKATVLCEQILMMPGFAGKPIKIPTPSTWKLEDGKWYWYVNQEDLNNTPFGRMAPGKGAVSGPLPGLGAIPTTADFVMNLVKADPQAISLKPGESGEVTIANGAPGPMTLSITGKTPGVETKFDHNELKAGEKAVLTLRAGENLKPCVVTVTVVQTNQLIPIQVNVK